MEYTNCESIDPGVWNGSCEDYLENEANLINIWRVDRPECQCRVSPAVRFMDYSDAMTVTGLLLSGLL